MAQLYSSGPCGVWVGCGTAGAPVFLGHAERTPTISIRPQFTDVFSDLGGQSVPFDKLYSGADAMVSMDLTRFNWGVYQTIAARSTAPGAGFVFPGSNFPGEIGTLMVTEGVATGLWLKFPYSAKPSMGGTASVLPTSNALPAGYHFFSAFLMGPDEITSGTVPNKIRCNWYCARSFSATAGNAYGQGAFILYDFNVNGLPNID